MTLNADQAASVRYFMGYSVTGDAASAPFRELAYSAVSYMGVSLDYRLDHLTAPEEARLTGFFLTNLALREAEIQGASANLDTAQAAVWTRNAAEVADRTSMFNALRMDLCHFLGFPPGSGLRTSSRLVRG